MGKQRTSFIFYKDWYDTICQLDDSSALEISKAIMAIAFGDEPPKMSGVSSALMLLIRPQIERDNEKYKTIVEKRSEAGKRHRGNQYVNVSALEQDGTNGTSVPRLEQMEQDGTNGTDNDNVDNNDVICKEKKEEDKSSLKKKFVKPSIEDVNAYIQEKNYHVDAESFYAFYESKGWKVGNQPMKDWHYACVTWEKRWKEKHNVTTDNTHTSATQPMTENKSNNYWQYA